MHFYATKADLMSALRRIEAAGPVTYAAYGSYPSQVFQKFDSALDLPALGIASTDSAASGVAYVVVSRGVKIVAREIRQSDGVIRYAVDQLHNPLSITFSPGGMRSTEALLYGRVATASTTPDSRRLLARFEQALRKDFSKVGAFYVGPEALVLLAEGVRLTAALQSPRGLDLRLPNKPVQSDSVDAPRSSRASIETSRSPRVSQRGRRAKEIRADD